MKMIEFDHYLKKYAAQAAWEVSGILDKNQLIPLNDPL